MRIQTCAALLAGLCLTLGACGKKTPMGATPPVPVVPEAPARTAPAQTARTERAPQQQSAASTPSRPSQPDAVTKARIQDLLDRIQDAYFDYDRHDIRPDAREALQRDAQTLTDILRQYPEYKLTVEGHADERGSTEYNLALADARAAKAKEFLATLGIPGEQLKTISYGKERPVCSDHQEDCWQKNRRAHITQAQ